MHSSNNAGQGSLEYLLLIAGGILVAIIAFLILLFLGPYGGGLIQEDIDEYNKIDLCTGKSAECEFFLNWDEGLASEPYGFVVENTSSWRTLYLSRMTLRLMCGNEICTSSDVGQSIPVTNIEFPLTILPTGPPYCPESPSGSGIYTCPYCNVTTENCFSFPGIPFCNGGVCQFEYDFSGVGIGITIPPNSSQKFGVEIGGLGRSSNLTGIQYSFEVKQLENGSLSGTGTDNDSDTLFWFSSNPDHAGALYACRSNAGSWTNLYGCTITPGCELHQCSEGDPLDPDDPITSYCGPNPPLDKIICFSHDTGIYSTPFCENTDSPANNGYFEINNTNGFALQLEVGPFTNVEKFVSSVPTGIYAVVHDFDTLSDCGPSTSCGDACEQLVDAQFSDVLLYDIGNPLPNNMCPNISTASTPLVYELKGIGNWNGVSSTRTCTAVFSFTQLSLDRLTAKAATGQHLFIGLVNSNGSSGKLSSPYTMNDTLPGRPSLQSLYFPK
ncbi:MAG: hypothetical protein V1776_02085 [Candidatus Diapherotrites archaeon]